jgi:hypothetical protein
MSPTIDDWRRPGPTARQRRIDLLIALAVLLAASGNVILSRSVGILPAGTARTAAEQLAWALVITLPLTWRRTRPEAVLLVVAGVFIAGQVRGTQETQFASGVIFAAG